MNKKILKLMAIGLCTITINSMIPNTITYAATKSDVEDTEDSKSFKSAINTLKSKIKEYKVSNDTSKSKIEDRIEKIIDTINYDLDFEITDFKKNKATSKESGEISYTIEVSDDDNSDLLDIEHTIKKLNTSNSTSNKEDNTTLLKKIPNDISLCVAQLVGHEEKIASEIKQWIDTAGSGTVCYLYDRDNELIGVLLKSNDLSFKRRNIFIGEGVSNLKNTYIVIPEINKFIQVENNFSIDDDMLNIINPYDRLYYITKDSLDSNDVIPQGKYTNEMGTFYIKDFKLQSGWIQDNNDWYYFNPKTYLLETNWLKINKDYYYLNNLGQMQTGWIQSNNLWYYLDPFEGTMCVGWKMIGNQWYYFEKSGSMITGWKKINKNWYYFNNDGSMANNTYIDGIYIESDGRALSKK